MLLDKPYGLLNLLEFKYDHFRSLFKAESQSGSHFCSKLIYYIFVYGSHGPHGSHMVSMVLSFVVTP